MHVALVVHTVVVVTVVVLRVPRGSARLIPTDLHGGLIVVLPVPRLLRVPPVVPVSLPPTEYGKVLLVDGELRPPE